MPIYEYACEKCGHEFEREQRISDAPVKTCPSCRARRVKRLISRTSFVLKGGGWYSDLYSSKAPAKSDAEGTAPAGESSESGKSAEAAPKSESPDKGKSPKDKSPKGKKSGKKSAA